MNRRHFLTNIVLTGALASLGVYAWRNRWHYLVIHHSAGRYGSIEFLQRVHRQRQAKDPLDAIPYHYVIGNGAGMGLGEVQHDWRQHYDIWGMHVSSNNPDKNFRGIGICLIGNLEEDPLPEEQYQSLVTLASRLIHTYDIPLDNIYGHGHISGESTLCPGKHFQLARLRTDLAQRSAV